MEVELLAEFEGFARQFRAFAFLRAVAEQTDAGPGAAENLAGINTAHHRVLREMQRSAFGVRARVESHETGCAAPGMTVAMPARSTARQRAQFEPWRPRECRPYCRVK